MVRTFNFIAPALQPGSLLDISIPEPSSSSKALQSIVRSIQIDKGNFENLGTVKRICAALDGSVILADDFYRISTLNRRPTEGDWSPDIVRQSEVTHATGDVWTGLTAVAGGAVASLSSGRLTYHRTSSTGVDELTVEGPLSNTVDGPVLALASSSSSATTVAVAGKDLEVSIRDVERTFASSSKTQEPSGKKRKTELVEGEVWRAKNMPNTSLQLRPPIHHTSLAYLLDTSSPDASSSTTQLISGTKAGTIRRYDTRQRKPVGEYKLAREGGIGAVAPVDEHEVFFADRGNFIGCADLRTGKLLYSYPGLTSSAHHLLCIPSSSSSKRSEHHPADGVADTSPEPYLASISPDATLRLHSTVPPRRDGQKGNPPGGKARVVGMAGGVGLGSFVFAGYGQRSDVGTEDKDGVEEEDDDGEDDDEGVWDEMDAVDDEASESGAEES